MSRPTFLWGFPGNSAGKESICNTEDPGSIPVSGRSPGEGIGYPLQSSWASLVAQLVKNPPAVWETWVLSLHWKDLLEKGMAIHYSGLENSMDSIVHGVSKSWTRLSNFHLSLFFTFPGSSTGKESTCNAGNPGLIPGSGRSLEKA